MTRGNYMRIITVFIIVCFLVVFGQPVYAEIIGETDAQVKKIAEPILDTILEGLENDDYSLYSNDFDVFLRRKISYKTFKHTDNELASSFGEYVSRQYLGFLSKVHMTVVLWKLRFDQSEDQVLVKIFISKRGDQYLVTGLWFQ